MRMFGCFFIIWNELSGCWASTTCRWWLLYILVRWTTWMINDHSYLSRKWFVTDKTNEIHFSRNLNTVPKAGLIFSYSKTVLHIFYIVSGFFSYSIRSSEQRNIGVPTNSQLPVGNKFGSIVRCIWVFSPTECCACSNWQLHCIEFCCCHEWTSPCHACVSPRMIIVSCPDFFARLGVRVLVWLYRKIWGDRSVGRRLGWLHIRTPFLLSHFICCLRAIKYRITWQYRTTC